jgi:hypothetical protein
MKKLILTVLIAISGAAAFAQDNKVTVADFAGTWNIEVMSHQMALVIEPKDAGSVTATMMVMGRDVALKGDLVDRTIKLVGIPGDPSTAEGGHVVAKPAGTGGQAITVTLQKDGTIAGEMMTNNGPVKWVGEKLKTRKKG